MPQAWFILDLDSIKFGRNCKVELESLDSDFASRRGSVTSTQMPSEDSCRQAQLECQRLTSSQTGSPVPSNSVTDLVELETAHMQYSEDVGVSSQILAVREEGGLSSGFSTSPSSPPAELRSMESAVPPSPLPVGAPVLPARRPHGLRTGWLAMFQTAREPGTGPSSNASATQLQVLSTAGAKSRKWWQRSVHARDGAAAPPSHALSVADVIHEDLTLRRSHGGGSVAGSAAVSEDPPAAVPKQMLTEYTLSVRPSLYL